ncbi:olfactory receptor 4E1 [Fukomys damarensis]|uniref:Olfactory receptor n=1 Tax=Fukomys damarensis TaxID=885580 RepID=A0A091D8Z2_FUKDA|nr:olfactory receptor 4E1 [Fukomys damarensis]KFO27552.1 Olfactory receptor 4E1 [Fukomys damarensis]
MEEAFLLNQTSIVTYFRLSGLSVNQKVQMAVFSMFLIFYVLTLIGNILIVITIIYDCRLHTPMYFFLSNLSFIDVCHSTVTVPKMLRDTWSAEKLISFDGCVTQMFFLHLFACTEIFLLTVMAYDRYVAICKPLRYMTVMNWKVCVLLAVALWTGGATHSIALTSLTIKLPYCGPDAIDNFFCDVPQVIKLACTDTRLIEILIVSNSGLISVVCFVVLVISYAVILVTLRQQISEGRRKALSTCAAHLTVVTLFLGHCIFIYSRPSTSLPEDKVVSVFFTAVTPLLNPIIYTLRNEEMKNALNKVMRRNEKKEGKFKSIGH